MSTSNNTERIIGIIDVDSFEVQIYQKRREWKYTIGKPTVVFDPTSGRIVAVSPEGKQLGVSRTDRVDKRRATLATLPSVICIPKEVVRNKPNSEPSRAATFQIRDSIIQFLTTERDGLAGRLGTPHTEMKVPIEINGSDEFFLDFTDMIAAYSGRRFSFSSVNASGMKVTLQANNRITFGRDLKRLMDESNSYFKLTNDQTRKLLIGLDILDCLRVHVLNETGFVCSAGLGTNQIRAKMACKLSKQDGITAIHDNSIDKIARTYKFRDITGFGGELGEKIEQLFPEVTTMKELQGIRISELISKLDNKPDAYRTQRLAKAECSKSMETKLMSKRSATGKNNLRLKNEKHFDTWLMRQCDELIEKLEDEMEKNKRLPVRFAVEYEYKDRTGWKNLSFQNAWRFTLTVIAWMVQMVGFKGGSIKNMAGKTEGRRSFMLDISAWRIKMGFLSSKVIFDAAKKAAVRNNPEFSNDLERITRIEVNVRKYESFGDVYVETAFSTRFSMAFVSYKFKQYFGKAIDKAVNVAKILFLVFLVVSVYQSERGAVESKS